MTAVRKAQDKAAETQRLARAGHIGAQEALCDCAEGRHDFETCTTVCAVCGAFDYVALEAKYRAAGMPKLANRYARLAREQAALRIPSDPYEGL